MNESNFYSLTVIEAFLAESSSLLSRSILKSKNWLKGLTKENLKVDLSSSRMQRRKKVAFNSLSRVEGFMFIQEARSKSSFIYFSGKTFFLKI